MCTKTEGEGKRRAHVHSHRHSDLLCPLCETSFIHTEEERKRKWCVYNNNSNSFRAIHVRILWTHTQRNFVCVCALAHTGSSKLFELFYVCFHFIRNVKINSVLRPTDEIHTCTVTNCIVCMSISQSLWMVNITKKNAEDSIALQ